MPNTREQVGPLEGGSEVVTPQAHPTDPFAAPIVQPPPENERAKDIASALTQFNPALQQLGHTLEYKFSKEDLEAGAALRTKSQGDWKQAVQSGQVPAGASPWFRMGYDRMHMELEGQQYDAALHQAYMTSSARNSHLPDDLQNFISGFQSSWLKQSGAESNPQFGHVMAPMLARSAMHLQQVHSSDVIHDTEEKSQEALGDLISGQLSGRMLYPNPDDVVAGIQARVDEAYKNGMPGTVANHIALEAIQRRAIMEEDPNLLDYIRQIKGSGGASMGDTVYGQQLIKEAQMQIFDLQRKKAEFDQWNYDRNKRLVTDQTLSAAIPALMKDPIGADITPYIQQANNAGVPEAAEKVIGLRDSMRKINMDNPVQIEALQEKIGTGEATADDFHKLAVSGGASTGTLDTLWKQYDLAKKHTATLIDPQIQGMKSDLGKAILGGDEIGVKLDPTVVRRANEAKNAFVTGIIQYEENNPKANYLDKLKYAQDLQRFLSQRVSDEAKRGTENLDSSGNSAIPVSTASDLDQAFTLTQKPAQASVQPPTSQQSAGQQSSNQPSGQPEWKTTPKFKSLDDLKAYGKLLQGSPEAQQALKGLGIDPQEYLEAQYALLKQSAK